MIKKFLFLSLLFCSLPLGASGINIDFSIDPGFKTRLQKISSQTRGETYFGKSQKLRVGYEFEKYVLIASYEQSQLSYDFDNQKKHSRSEQLGLGFAYKFLDHFQSGFQLSQSQSPVTENSQQVLSISGMDISLFVGGQFKLYRNLYGTFYMSKTALSFMKSKGGMPEDYTVSEQSFHLGVGYHFAW